ncbi:MAG: NAD(P)-dependent dehydrogenase (short-subunit alcohol dehydrogenase family) [Porticoccus sp.]|jgi:NAD(P)-dependent dehydrogenase (short-subunit alcohol dehydrogenase family)
MYWSRVRRGVDMITRTTAIEWGPEGVRVNSLVPGPIEGTEGMKRLAPSESSCAKLVVDSVSLKRQGTVVDMANAALFIASDLASYTNGAILPVNGGWGLGGAGQLGQSLATMAQLAKSAQVPDA